MMACKGVARPRVIRQERRALHYLDPAPHGSLRRWLSREWRTCAVALGFGVIVRVTNMMMAHPRCSSTVSGLLELDAAIAFQPQLTRMRDFGLAMNVLV